MPVADGHVDRLQNVPVTVACPFQAGGIDAAQTHRLVVAVEDFCPDHLQRQKFARGICVFRSRRCNWCFQVRAIQFHRKGNSRFLDNLRAAADFGQFRRVVQFENDDFILSPFEPFARQEQRTQAAVIPEPSKVVAVDPDRAHAPIAHIEERAAEFVQDECAAIKSRAGVLLCRGFEIVHVVIWQ